MHTPTPTHPSLNPRNSPKPVVPLTALVAVRSQYWRSEKGGEEGQRGAQAPLPPEGHKPAHCSSVLAPAEATWAQDEKHHGNRQGLWWGVPGSVGARHLSFGLLWQGHGQQGQHVDHQQTESTALKNGRPPSGTLSWENSWKTDKIFFTRLFTFELAGTGKTRQLTCPTH